MRCPRGSLLFVPMMDDHDWKLKVVQRCPLFIEELQREEVVEWVIERTDTDNGTLQVEYTRCDALNRPFACRAVTASVWSYEEEDEFGLESGAFYLVKARHDFAHIGLAKRWAAAENELMVVDDANEFLKHRGWLDDD